MADSESSAVTEHPQPVHRPPSDSGAYASHPRLIQRPPTSAAPPVAQGTPAPEWASPRSRVRARGTLPPPIPRDARPAAPPPIPRDARPAAPPPIPPDARPGTGQHPAAPPVPTGEHPAASPPMSHEELPPLPQPRSPQPPPPRYPDWSQARPPAPQTRAPAPAPQPQPAPRPPHAPPVEHLESGDDTVPAPRIDENELEFHWFDDSAPVSPTPAEDIEAPVRVPEPAPARPSEPTEIAHRPARSRWPIVVGIAGGLIGSAAIAAYIASSGPGVQPAASGSAAPAAAPADNGTDDPDDGAATATAPTAAAAPAVADEPGDDTATPEPAVKSTGPVVSEARPVSVFTSEPSGATVTLIEDGQPRTLGKTPVEAELAPNRHYEVMFALSGYATTLQSLDLGDDGTARVEVELQAPGTTPEVAEIDGEEADDEDTGETAADEADEDRADEDRARAEKRRRARAEKRRRARAEKRRRARAEKRRQSSTRAVEGRDERDSAKVSYGLLAVGSKPPCDIYIDGRNSGLTTPQRAIKLKPGVHEVTLFNRSHRIKKTFRVRIAAGKRTRVIRDLTDKMR